MATNSLTAGDRQFVVTALRNIGTKIRKGDHVWIDPDQQPVAGKYVLVGELLKLWAGEADFRGVAVRTGRVLDEAGPEGSQAGGVNHG